MLQKQLQLFVLSVNSHTPCQKAQHFRDKLPAYTHVPMSNSSTSA